MKPLVRILVADDSQFFADAVRAVIEVDPLLRVAGTAGNGVEAVRLASRLKPDLIIMDIRMPMMDGFTAIEKIMANCPTPILVMTADPRGENGELSMEALRRGALDLILKPVLWDESGGGQQAFRNRIKLLSSIPVVHHVGGSLRDLRAASLAPKRSDVARLRIVGVVASTGGPTALAQILSTLPPRFPLGILIIQHLAEGFAENLALWLQRETELVVRVASDGDAVEAGRVFIGGDGRDLVIDTRGRLRLVVGAPGAPHLPSGTRMLSSLAESYGRSGIGVILTGMGDDGVDGLRELRDAGGVTIAQDQDSSVVFGMPRRAAESGAATHVLPLERIGIELCHLVGCREAGAA